MTKEHYPTDYPDSGTYGSGQFSAGTIVQTRVGELPDAFVLRGNTLVRMPEAGFLNSFVAVTTGVEDVTTIDLGGGRQGAVHVGSGGLRLTEVTTSNLETNVATTTMLSSSDTTGVQVRVADVYGTTYEDLVVLDQTGTTFRIYLGSAAGFSSSPDITTHLSGTQALDFDLAKLDTSRSRFLVAAPNGFRVYRLNGAGDLVMFMNRTNSVYTENQVETLHDHVSDGIDGFAWLTKVSSTGAWAVTGGHNHTFQAPTMLPADGEVGEVVGMSAGRIDATGQLPGVGQDRDDLAFSFSKASRLGTMLNQGTSPSGAFAPFTHFEVTAFSGTNVGSVPIVGDLDDDGVGDLLIGNNNGTAGSLEVIYRVDDTPFLGDSTDWDWSDNLTAWDIQPGATTPLTMAIDYDPTNTVTHAESAVWFQDSDTTPFLPAAIAACDDNPIVPSGTDSLVTQLMDTSPTADWLDMDGDFTEGHFFVVRLRPSTPLNTTGRRPAIYMAIDTYQGGSGSSLYPTNTNSRITVRQGAVHDQIYDPTTPPPSAQGGDSTVAVGKIPIRRLSPPPGVIHTVPPVAQNCQ